jgi:hypothetical protein
MAVNPLSFKFKAMMAFLVDQVERTKITIGDIEALAPMEYRRFNQRITAAEAAYKEDKAHDMDVHLGYARKDYFHGVNAVIKRKSDDTKKGISHG